MQKLSASFPMTAFRLRRQKEILLFIWIQTQEMTHTRERTVQLPSALLKELWSLLKVAEPSICLILWISIKVSLSRM